MLRPALLLFPVAFVLTLASACEGSREPDIEILPPASLAVLLSEANGAPVSALAEQRILAGEQYVLLSRSDGGKPSERLVELDLRPGPHRIDLGDDDEPVVVVFEAVSKDEIVDIELLRADESELRPGTWVEVDLVGVTEDGAHVRSMHPRFETGSETRLGYFAYRFDPDATPQTLTVDALDWRVRTQFRGWPRASD